MATTLTAKVDLKQIVTFLKTPEVAGQLIQAPMNITQTLINLTSGTGLDKGNLLFVDTRTLAGAATENLNMNTLVDPMGAAQTWACVKWWAVFLKTLTVGASLQVGGLSATTAWQSPFGASDDAKVTLGPGGSIVMSNPSALGWAVTDVTNHLLKIANDSSPSISEDYLFIAIGATATS